MQNNNSNEPYYGQDQIKDVFLCHKCAGILTKYPNALAYPCNCISSYVRDWQLPTPLAQVRDEQMEALEDRLLLYKNQGRKPTEPPVAIVYAAKRLAIWEAAP